MSYTPQNKLKALISLLNNPVFVVGCLVGLFLEG